jgi:hypothetical protein
MAFLSSNGIASPRCAEKPGSRVLDERESLSRTQRSFFLKVAYAIQR